MWSVRSKPGSPDIKGQLIEADDKWGDIDTWALLKAYSPRYTPGYFLNAVDAEMDADGIGMKPENQRIYLFLFGRTLMLSMIITFSCLLLGYPISYLLAHLSLSRANLLMVLVLLPFWTSLLVRYVGVESTVAATRRHQRYSCLVRVLLLTTPDW